jgi:SAM-dependent methyltransferase
MKMNLVAQQAQELYNQNPFGDFTYGRRAREVSDSHLLTFLSMVGPDGRFYDIGCGCGFWNETYHRYGIQRPQITCLDLAPNNVENLKSQGYRAITGSVLDLPFADNVSDFTVCQGVIMHTDNPLKAFSELVRITRPGGKIYLSVYNKWHPYFYLIHKATFPIRYLYWHYNKAIIKPFYPFFWLFFQIATRMTMGSFLDAKSCRTIFMDQVLTPRAYLFSKNNLQSYAQKYLCAIDSFGYSPTKVMLSAIISVGAEKR